MEDKNASKFVDNHKKEWIDLLTNNDEVLPYLAQLYAVEDELTINYRDGISIRQLGRISGISKGIIERILKS